MLSNQDRSRNKCHICRRWPDGWKPQPLVFSHDRYLTLIEVNDAIAS